jgi:hypothetical protein
VVLHGPGDGALHRRFLESSHPPPRLLRRLANRLVDLDPEADEQTRIEAVARAAQHDPLRWRRDPPEPGGLLRALERYDLVPRPTGLDPAPSGTRSSSLAVKRANGGLTLDAAGSHGADPTFDGAIGPDPVGCHASASHARPPNSGSDRAARPWSAAARARRGAAQDRLRAMDRYLTTRRCRRAALLGYFGEDLARGPCAGCDRCQRGLADP